MRMYGNIARREGQLGIPGTSEEERLTPVDVPIFYVDSGHTNASDDNDGTDPLYPLATIQGLIDRTAAHAAGTSTREPVLENYSTIYVSGTVSEDVQTGDYTQMPSYVSIIGTDGSGARVIDVQGDIHFVAQACGSKAVEEEL